jgi:rhodanese-related sulfurtransferase
MKKLNLTNILILVFVFSIFISCSDQKESRKEVEVKALPIPEFEMLMDHLEYTGDFINTRKTPSYITAESLYEILDDNINIIDLRKAEDFNKGHIKGAMNVPLNRLIQFLEEDIFPANVEKNILVSYTGQESGYAASALRFMGYANFWSLKYGMSSWNRVFAKDHWIKEASSKYSSELEKAENPMMKAGNYPEIHTGEKFSVDILEHRVNDIFNEGFEKAVITADHLFQNLEDYYIINYWPEKHYKLGHIKGAVRYQPRESLKRDVALNTLPVEKPIAVYCYTGQTAAHITAYLRIIGYDAYSVKFGANGFMYDVMQKHELPGWYPAKMNDFSFETAQK